MMRLTATEDIEGTQDQVFAALSDFDAIERQAMRRGIEISRQSGDSDPKSGMAWNAGFEFRGKQRKADIKLTSYSAPEQMVFHNRTGGLDVEMQVDCVALSRSRTRINIVAELSPQTLSARLLVQSLKLAKGGVDKRFSKRMAGLAKDLENKLKRTA